MRRRIHYEYRPRTVFEIPLERNYRTNRQWRNARDRFYLLFDQFLFDTLNNTRSYTANFPTPYQNGLRMLEHLHFFENIHNIPRTFLHFDILPPLTNADFRLNIILENVETQRGISSGYKTLFHRGAGETAMSDIYLQLENIIEHFNDTEIQEDSQGNFVTVSNKRFRVIFKFLMILPREEIEENFGAGLIPIELNENSGAGYDFFTDIGNDFFRDVRGSDNLSSNFKKGMKDYYIISHRTYENCVFTCIKQYLLFASGDKKQVLNMSNKEICVQGSRFKTCIENYVSSHFGPIDFNNLNDLLPAIIYYLEKKNILVTIYLHSIKFSVIKVFKNSKNIKGLEIHLRIYNKHAQLLLRERELNPELLQIISEKYHIYQLQAIKYENAEIIKDPLNRQYYFENQTFNTLSEFEEYAFRNDVNIFNVEQLNKIQYNKPKTTEDKKSVENQFKRKLVKIGAYDIETFSILEQGIQVPFALGVCYGKGLVKIFWGTLCVIEFFEFIRANPLVFRNMTLYAHNQSKFDGFLLFKYLVHFPNWLEIVSKNILIVNNGILKFTLRFTYGSKNETFQVDFKDSFRMLPTSLHVLGKSFNVEHKKLDFDIEQEAKNWQDPVVKERIIKYLEHDTLCLYEIIEEMELFFSQENLNLGDLVTIPSATVQIFIDQFWDQDKYPLPILKQPYERILRNIYQGGRNEAFYIGNYPSNPPVKDFNQAPFFNFKIEDKKQGKKFMLDINSLYPKVMRDNDLPFDEYHYYNQDEIMGRFVDMYGNLNDECFGFLLVRHKGVNCIHGYKTPEKLLFPVYDEFTFLSLYSEEIKYNQRYCNQKKTEEYEYLGLIQFSRGPLLKEFIEHFWEQRKQAIQEGKKGIDYIIKHFMNDFYGYCGMKLDKKNVKVAHNKDADELVEMYFKSDKLNDLIEHGNYTFLEVFEKIDPKISAVYLSAAITSLARLELFKAMDMLRKLGGDIYYVDTDSILFSIEDESVLFKGEFYERYLKDNHELGKFKDEFYKLAKEAVQDGKISKELFERTTVNNTLFPIQFVSIGGCKMYQATCLIYEQTLPYHHNGCRLEKSAIKGLKRSDNTINFQDVFKDGIKVKAQTEFHSSRPSLFRTKDMSFDEEQASQAAMPYMDLGLTVSIIEVPKEFKSIYEKGVKVLEQEENTMNFKIVPYNISSRKRNRNEGALNEWNFLKNKLV